MQASVVWSKGMSFTGTADSGHTVAIGTDPGVGGDDDGLRPMELMAISLAGCTAMDVISILRKKRVDVTGLRSRSTATVQSSTPRCLQPSTSITSCAAIMSNPPL